MLSKHLSTNKIIRILAAHHHSIIPLMGQFVFSILQKFNFMCLVICVGQVGCFKRLSALTQIMLVHLTLTQFSSLLVTRRLWMDFWPHAFYYYLPSLILSIRKTEISLMSYCVLIALKPKFSLILT